MVAFVTIIIFGSFLIPHDIFFFFAPHAFMYSIALYNTFCVCVCVCVCVCDSTSRFIMFLSFFLPLVLFVNMVLIYFCLPKACYPKCLATTSPIAPTAPPRSVKKAVEIC